MGKVMSGDGTTVNVPNHVPKDKKATETPKPSATDKPAELPKELNTDSKPAAVVEDVEKPAGAPVDEMDPEDAELSEKVRTKIGKKHRAMKEAQEAHAEAERFAEQQYNERVLTQKRAEAAEARLAEIEKQAKPKVKEAGPPSQQDKDESGNYLYIDAQGNLKVDEYVDAKTKYAAEQAVKSDRQRQADEKSAAEQAEMVKKVRASAERARAAHSDFDDVINEVSKTERDNVPKFVSNYLSESENAGELVYALAKDPELSQRIAKMSPIRGIVELGKLEEGLTPKPVKVEAPAVRQSPPPPITPVSTSGSTTVNTDPSKMNYKELRAYEKARAEKGR